MKCLIAIITIALLLAHPFANADFPKDMYDFKKLQKEQARYELKINEFYRTILLKLLAKRDRDKLMGKVVLDIPMMGNQLLDFYTTWRGDRATGVLPASSLLFIEDLTTAFAWLHFNNYSVETVEEYVTMLKYKDASEFPHGHYPAPFEALFVPQNALSDKRVDTLGLRLRNSAYAFIILHELAHFLYRHPGYDSITTAQARLNEAEADRFALKVIESGNTIPLGIVIYFAAQINYLPSKGQILAEGGSEGDWQHYVQKEQTHPLTAERLKGIARYLNDWAQRAGPDNTYPH